VTHLRIENGSNWSDPLFEPALAGRREVLGEDAFNRMIVVERKRTERSKQPFLLMLLEGNRHEGAAKNGGPLDGVASALLPSIRETDSIGWYKDSATIGVLYTGLIIHNRHSVLSMILNRVSTALGVCLTADQFSQVSISFHFFPDEWGDGNSGRPSNPALYPDLIGPQGERRPVAAVKRACLYSP
jgi:hypothetical protein